MGPLIPLFGTFGDICPGFQSQGGFPCLHALSPVHNRFLRFTFGVTSADLLAANMAAEPFDPHTCIQAYLHTSILAYKSRIKHHASSIRDKTDDLPTELTRPGEKKKEKPEKLILIFTRFSNSCDGTVFEGRPRSNCSRKFTLYADSPVLLDHAR